MCAVCVAAKQKGSGSVIRSTLSGEALIILLEPRSLALISHYCLCILLGFLWNAHAISGAFVYICPSVILFVAFFSEIPKSGIQTLKHCYWSPITYLQQSPFHSHKHERKTWANDVKIRLNWHQYVSSNQLPVCVEHTNWRDCRNLLRFSVYLCKRAEFVRKMYWIIRVYV